MDGRVIGLSRGRRPLNRQIMPIRNWTVLLASYGEEEEEGTAEFSTTRETLYRVTTQGSTPNGLKRYRNRCHNRRLLLSSNSVPRIVE